MFGTKRLSRKKDIHNRLKGGSEKNQDEDLDSSGDVYRFKIYGKQYRESNESTFEPYYLHRTII